MNWLPRSSFARLVLLIGGLVLLVLGTFFGLATHLHSQQVATSQGRRVGKEIITVERVLLRSTDPERNRMRNLLLGELGFRTSSIPPRGVVQLNERIFFIQSRSDGGGTRLLGFRHRASSSHRRGQLDFFEEGVQQVLGPQAQLFVRVRGRGDLRGEPRIWIRTGRQGVAWVGIPGNHLTESKPVLLVYWIGGIALLVFLAALLFVRQLNRPLLALVRAVESFGRGEKQEDLAESGPEEVRKLTRAFNKMARDVSEAAEDRELMLAGISHDLRSPLARLSVALEIASQVPDDLKQSMLEDITDMDAIVGQFLDYVRTGMNESVDEVELVGLVREVADREQRIWLQSAPDRRIQFDLPAQIHFPVRPMSIKRLLQNLIENAARYGGNQIFVALGKTEAGIMLSVEDDGTEIVDEDLSTLFRPFARGNQARTTRGSGLGLAIVKKIVGLHGGQVYAEKSSHGGLRFVIELPRAAAEAKSGSFPEGYELLPKKERELERYELLPLTESE